MPGCLHSSTIWHCSTCTVCITQPANACHCTAFTTLHKHNLLRPRGPWCHNCRSCNNSKFPLRDKPTVRCMPVRYYTWRVHHLHRWVLVRHRGMPSDIYSTGACALHSTPSCMLSLVCQPLGQLHVLCHDGHSLGMDGSRLGVVKKGHQEGLCSLPEGLHSRGLHAVHGCACGGRASWA